MRRILEIMKDSHIGTYGVLGLVFYELLLAATLMSIPPCDAAMMVLAGDTYSKMITSQLVLMMPYARRCIASLAYGLASVSPCRACRRCCSSSG